MTTPAHFKAASRLMARNATDAGLRRTLQYLRAEMKLPYAVAPWRATQAGVIRAELAKRNASL